MRGTHPTPCQKGSALTFNHGRNTSKNHTEKAQHSHPIMGGTHPRTISKRLNTYIWPWEEHIQESCQKGSILISNHGRNTSKNHVRKDQHLYLAMWGTHLASMLERLNTYIWPWKELILACYKGSALTSNHGRNQSYHHVRSALHLHLTMGGTNPTMMSERHTDSYLPLGSNLNLENTKILFWSTKTSLWPFIA